jgi:hypothetical protein
MSIRRRTECAKSCEIFEENACRLKNADLPESCEGVLSPQKLLHYKPQKKKSAGHTWNRRTDWKVLTTLCTTSISSQISILIFISYCLYSVSPFPLNLLHSSQFHTPLFILPFFLAFSLLIYFMLCQQSHYYSFFIRYCFYSVFFLLNLL